MNVIQYPKAFQSAFRPALFLLDGVTAAPDGTDVAVLPASDNTPLGVKRIYGQGQITVNAAPFVRRLLAPQPLCGQPAGMIRDQRRYAGCRVSADGYTSATVYLTAGTENATTAKILSAAPGTVKIRPDEKDEISVVSSGNAVKPFVNFALRGVEYTVDSIQSGSGMGMHTFVVDAAEIEKLFTAKTGADSSLMDAFTVSLRVSESGGETFLTRRYIYDNAPHNAPHNGRRLAWVNRYGAIDYYTFPVAARQTETGKKELIETGDGVRVVGTSSNAALMLESEYEAAETLCWLAEIYSSPKVWAIEEEVFTEVDADAATASFDPRMPGKLTVKISTVEPAVSRKF